MPEVDAASLADPTLTPPPETSPDMQKLSLTERRGALLGLGISNVHTPPSMCDDIYGLEVDCLGVPSLYDNTFANFYSDPYLNGLYDAPSGSKDMGLPFDLDWIKDATVGEV